MTLESIIRETRNLLEDDGITRNFSSVSKIYPFTTEHIQNYLSQEKIEGKTILTVSGSGDHILNLMSLKAKKILGFDINFLSMLYTNLKIAAATILSYEKYVSFFSLESEYCWSKSIYQIIRKKMDSRALGLFDFLYGYALNQSLRSLPIFYQSPIVDMKIKEYNFYLNSISQYELIKEWNGHYEWLNSGIESLKENLDKNEKFDFILLSNIMDYAKYMFPGDDYNKYFINKVLLPLVRKLKDNGKVFAAIVFDREKNITARNELVDENYWNSTLKDEKIDVGTIVYDSAISGKKDMTITLSNVA